MIADATRLTSPKLHETKPLPVREAERQARFGFWAGALTLAGVLLSGPIAILVIRAVAPQPDWTGAGTFAASYHWIQRLPYALGLLLITGGVMMVLTLARASDATAPERADLARVLAAVFATMIALNYVIQTTFVPALLAETEPGGFRAVGLFAMANPSSLAWSLEMWGYGILGVALWLVASVLDRTALERATALLIGANGLISLIGGLLTSARQDWVFTRVGLLSFAGWNVLMAVLALCFLLVWRARLHAPDAEVTVLRSWRARSAVEAFARSLEREAGEASSQRFRPDMVEDLPEPARRYLLHAIQPDAPLATSVRLVLNGSIRLARNADPMAMESEELLAPPHAYVWNARVRRGMIRINGFDAYAKGSGEMRWWLAGVIPIVRAKGQGLARSAEGRLLGESIFMPSSLLPTRGACWEAVNESTVRVHVRGQLEEVVLTLEIDSSGALRRLSFPRWNDDVKNGPVGYLRFVSDDFTDERTFDGYTIPTRFRSGWRLGEEGELPFFFATIERAEFR